MTGWLLDTNVISELRKTNCHRNVKAWADKQPPHSFYLSRITIAEIRFGIEQVSDASFINELVDWLDNTLRPWFDDRILEVEEDILLTWRRMVEKGRKQRHTFSQPDLFIAATASIHDLCVVTRNIEDFEKAGVSVLNPWEKHE